MSNVTLNKEDENNIALATEGTENLQVAALDTSNTELVADDERAIVDEAELAAYNEARSRGFFDQSYGMSNLTGVLNNAIYADKQVESNGEIHIRFTQRYSDGGYLPILQIKQSELLTAALCKFDANNAPSTCLKRRVNKFLDSLWHEYTGKVRSHELLNPQEILIALSKSLPYLPEYKAGSEELTREQFYARVIATMEEAFGWGWIDSIRRKSYYMLGTEEVAILADKLETTAKALIEKLAKYRFLYLPESCQGYQAKVRTAGDQSEWKYCIMRLDYLGQPKEVKPIEDPNNLTV